MFVTPEAAPIKRRYVPSCLHIACAPSANAAVGPKPAPDWDVMRPAPKPSAVVLPVSNAL